MKCQDCGQPANHYRFLLTPLCQPCLQRTCDQVKAGLKKLFAMPKPPTVADALTAADIELPSKWPGSHWLEIPATCEVGARIVKLLKDAQPIIAQSPDVRLTELLLTQCDIWYYG